MAALEGFLLANVARTSLKYSGSLKYGINMLCIRPDGKTRT